MAVKSARSILITVMFIGVTMSLPSECEAESKRVALGISALSAVYAPLFIAKDVGLFEKYGLDVDVILISAGPIVHGILAGDVKAAGAGASRIVASNLEGSGILMLAATNDRMPYMLIVPPEIKNPSQLKGKTVGVAEYGGLDDTAMRYALLQMGLTPDKDVTVIQAGGKGTRFSALQQRAIAAIVIDPPYTLQAKQLGLNFLFDFLKSSPKTVYGTLAAKDSYIKQNPEIIQGLLKSLVSGVQYYKTHKPESIKIMAKYMRVDLPAKAAEMEETYNVFVNTAKCRPYIDTEGVQNLLNELGRKIPKARTASPQSFVDMRFIKELDESGFIDSVCQ